MEMEDKESQLPHLPKAMNPSELMKPGQNGTVVLSTPISFGITTEFQPHLDTPKELSFGEYCNRYALLQGCEKSFSKTLSEKLQEEDIVGSRAAWKQISGSSPTRFLANYIDSSNGLIHLFPWSSPKPVSKDPGKYSFNQLDQSTSPGFNFGISSGIGFSRKFCKPSDSGPSSNATILESSSQQYFHFIGKDIGETNAQTAVYATETAENADALVVNDRDLGSTGLEDSSLMSINPTFSNKMKGRALDGDKPLPSSPIAKGSSLLNRPKPNKRGPKKKVGDKRKKPIVEICRPFFDDTTSSAPPSSCSSQLAAATVSKAAAFKKGRPSKIQKPPLRRVGRVVSGRSKNGCWTCRLRRKKCTEEKPECGECARLELSCDSSDIPRPAYMNDKKLAKKKMDEIKEITNMKKRIRMASRVSKLARKVSVDDSYGVESP